ncbi:MAG: ABC transporter permease [Fibrobacterales bacterium]
MIKEQHKNSYSLPGIILSSLGSWVSQTYVGQILMLFLKASSALIKNTGNRTNTRDQVIRQIYFTGVEAVPLICLMACILGTIVIIQGLGGMSKVGFDNFFGDLMVLVIIRELGPVLTAFLIAGRTGSALATLIGTMKVKNETDALQTLGIDPINYLVMPAIWSGTIAIVVLTFLFNTVAICVGFLVVKGILFMFQDVLQISLQWSLYMQGITDAMSTIDIVLIIIKPAIFGIIVTTVACYQGLALDYDFRNVPKATQKSVVRSFILVIIANMILSLLYLPQYIKNLSGVL